MEESLSWQAVTFPASQAIPRILWNPQADFRFQKSSVLPLPLRNMNMYRNFKDFNLEFTKCDRRLMYSHVWETFKYG
jgi:hypothetical protein